MNTEDVMTYVAAFNRLDYDTQHSYYHPDVELELPKRRLVGSDGIRAHYDGLHSAVRELLALDFVMVDERHIALEIYTEFRAFADRDGFTFGPLKAGDVFRCTNMGHFDLKDGLLWRIRVGSYRVWGDDERTEAKQFPGIARPLRPGEPEG
ncbi:hypothetical protein GCM10011490_26490 [Pseudoclavibacter endophyticus]|uniref:Nuclear transport factor 2 family protein n=1 Tax=Pseudoclavibacter endophyticus TaxID=1778590 RepID=A0A6H9WH67_9MICO|nr:nuclear transport factor 2 family protein [Pseudoclavibacter endophyticus]KAB1646911.1 nuclear transport factor 2 family protein [Pseudoclavibacter endophyticus]GGA74495.1 hypothetical protein GCM10011490_26490 [Pseudoclavibacter endophyticus]